MAHGRAGGAGCTGDLEASARHSGSSETGESLAAGCAAGADRARRGRWKMARTNLSSMSVDALFTLRENVEEALSGKAKELQDQLSRLGRASGFRNRGRGSSLKGQKVPIKYRDRSGNTWAGRGAQPVWLREKLKGGAKLEDFAVGKTVASRNASPRKTRRRAKR
jgi:DNA-binding protein H-NS